ncbi:MAG: molybdenum cofactor guanylyltransferase [Calditerrivibrio sp.]|nr:molybdenum cofactor guanylyltransferase [Calditerrivibrio sp.]
MRDFSIAILAGGQSRRFGSDKSFAKIGEKCFFQICYEKALNITDDIMIIAKDLSKYPDLKNLRKIKDSLTIQTPLVGILTACQHAFCQTLFVWSVDSPFMDENIIKNICYSIGSHDAAIPVIYQKIHPLLACYNKRINGILENFLSKGNLKVLDFLKSIDVFYLNEEMLLPKENLRTIFANVNTKEDLNLTISQEHFEKNNS